MFAFKGSLSPSKNDHKLDKDLYCTLHKFVLIPFIQKNQGHRDAVMQEFSSSVNKLNKAVAKVRTIGDRLYLMGALVGVQKRSKLSQDPNFVI